MTIKVGDTVPQATLKTMTADGMSDVDTSSYFAGRKVAVFGVPGAFTPTCSAQHLPGFVAQADALKAKGVDEIACMAVNDAFVMNAWGKAGGAPGKVTMLADGNADFTRKLDLAVDLTAAGFGTRCQRFSMLVNDGRVEQIHVEEPGEFKVSSAEHMLENL